MTKKESLNLFTVKAMIKPKSGPKITNVFGRSFIYSLSAIILLVLVLIVIFLIDKSVSAFQKIGFGKFITGSVWQSEKNLYGIWPFIVATFWVVIISLLFAVPLTIFSSIFIVEFLSRPMRRIVITIIELLSGIPSVVFGLFGLTAVGVILMKFGAPTRGNMLTAAFVLAFMALPTMIMLTINALSAVPGSYRDASLGLGLSKQQTAFNVVRKSAKLQIITAIIAGLGRVIGETMAVSLIAGGGTNIPAFDHGFTGWLFSSIRTLSSAIGIEIGEAVGHLHESALYAIGIILFIIVTIINLIIIFVSNYNKWRWKLQKKFRKSNSENSYLNLDNNVDYRLQIIKNSSSNKKTRIIKDVILNLFMWSSTIIVVGFTSWVIIDVIVQAATAFHNVPVVGTAAGTQLGSVVLTTIILILTSLIISVPFSLIIAVFIVEYGKTKWVKNSYDFFINILLSSPSILYGMFGLAVFISVFNMPLSIATAGLTLTLVIIPIMVRSIANELELIPNDYRYNALALGLTKIQMIFQVIIPAAKNGIITSIILAMGRIAGESAPVFLTLGTTVAFPHAGILSSGRTLTTQILLLIKESTNPHAVNLAYQASLISFVMIFTLNFCAKSLNGLGKIKKHFVKFLEKKFNVKNKYETI